MTHRKAAYQGRPGAYSELAARQLLKAKGADLSCSTLACTTFSAVLNTVLSGQAHYGVLPIYNTIIGDIRESCGLLATEQACATVQLLDETTLPVSHVLLALPGTCLTNIRQVYSHPAALAQCSYFFSQHPDITAISATDTAGAVEWLIHENKSSTIAAIAGAPTAQLYGAQVLLHGLENNPDNHTRFVLIAKRDR